MHCNSYIVRFLPAILFIFGIVISASGQKLTRAETRAAEERLQELGYWLKKADGVVDRSTRHAVTAFQKVEGRNPTGALSRTVLTALEGSARPVPRDMPAKRHIEVDISKQVLYLFDANGEPKMILPVSTGNEERYLQDGKWHVARTVTGDFKVLRKINGVRRAPLGVLYYPMYFYEGWAIHGSNSVPTEPASHGCVRVPRGADRELFRIVPVGTPVIVYE